MAKGMHTKTAVGRHKDGSYYIRACDGEACDAIQDAADKHGITLVHRKAAAVHNGEEGVFNHFHTEDPGHVQTIMAELGQSAEEGTAEEKTKAGEGEDDATGAGDTHIHVHLHEEGREVSKALVQAHERHLSTGQVVQVKEHHRGGDETHDKIISHVHDARSMAEGGKHLEAHESFGHAKKLAESLPHEHPAMDGDKPLHRRAIEGEMAEHYQKHLMGTHKDPYLKTHRAFKAGTMEAHHQTADEYEKEGRHEEAAQHREIAENIRKQAEMGMDAKGKPLPKPEPKTELKAPESEDPIASYPKPGDDIHANRSAKRTWGLAHHEKLSKMADEATTKARESGSREDHQHAATLHDYAQHAHMEARMAKADGGIAGPIRTDGSDPHGMAVEHHYTTRHDVHYPVIHADERPIKKSLDSKTAIVNLLQAAQRWHVESQLPEHITKGIQEVPWADVTAQSVFEALESGVMGQEALNVIYMATGGNTAYGKAVVSLLGDRVPAGTLL